MIPANCDSGTDRDLSVAPTYLIMKELPAEASRSMIQPIPIGV